MASVAAVAANSSFADASHELLRRTLLVAARELAADRPWRSVTMAAIATRAGVSRQTVYNEFGSRAGLTQALVLHELDEFLAVVDDAIRSHADDPAAALAAALEVFLRAAAEDPLVAAVINEDGREELLPLVTSQGRPLLRHGTDRLATIVRETWPIVTAPDADFLAECIVRLGLSYIVMPVASTVQTADGVARLVRPYIQELLEGLDG